MISKTTFVCILMVSLFAIGRCRQLDVGEIKSSSNFIFEKCVRDRCGEEECWCCVIDPLRPCKKTDKECNADGKCPIPWS
ncbi:hypothetical protein IGI04_011202 [Brassica rapa subsp. trilocularis]|uniref:Embryo surrounding factor 1 brassicaceae domain-containing protein n=3 Tax=Brassica TaxID=3705 RepID=A0A8D9LP83_BRACM|nr:hypothetical protein IGI04_011202 [Brassica rapa subsp. trilocularis]CAF2125242.1 unnamed protein product [Brassica napus]CAG7881622.1 unnamed protein product [Brassica rapa]